MKVEELRQFASVMREMGIQEYSAAGVTIRMGGPALPPSDPAAFDRVLREALKKAEADEEALTFASSEGSPDPALDDD